MSRSELLPALARIKWAGRDMAVAYDSDVAEKPRVQAAEQRLTNELTARGAIVRPVRLPAAAAGKAGVDDYLLSHSIEEFIELVQNTAPASSSYEPPTSLCALMARKYPPTEYAWAEFVLKGETNLLFGDGGIGKSLLALYIAVAVAAGRPLFGGRTIQMPVIGLFAEDGEAEVQHRVQAILINLGLEASGDLAVKLWCQPREDTLLASIDDNGNVKELQRLHALRAELAKIGRPALVILDSLADLFALNENLRLPVNAALKRVLGTLCREFGATVIVLAHPSKASMQDGSHYSGSTAFNNAVRQRLTLEIVKREAGGTSDGPPPRRLSVAKSNYGPPAEKTLWFYGTTIDVLPNTPTVSPLEERQLVLSTTVGLIDKGIRVVKANGAGQKAGDVADAVREKHSISIPPSRIRQHLSALERDEQLAYRSPDKNARPYVPSQYIRGQKCRL